MATDFYPPLRSKGPGKDTAEVLDQLSGYSGSIAGTPVDEALDELRDRIFDAQSIVEIASRALQDLSEDGKEPGYTRALGNVRKSLDEIAAGLEAGTLEDRALAIARAKLKE
jgi:hypothetical protein